MSRLTPEQIQRVKRRVQGSPGHQGREAAGGAAADGRLFVRSPPRCCTEGFPKVKALPASRTLQPPQKREGKRESLWCIGSEQPPASNGLTFLSLTTSMNKTSKLRFTISPSAIFSEAEMAGNRPRWASCRQCSLFLWEIFARTLRT